MVPKRTAIRHYVVNMLKDGVDVGNRVFIGRANTPLFVDELPAINVHFGDEAAEEAVGDRYHVSEYSKVLPVIVTIVVEQQLTSGNPLYEQSGEDYADYLGAQVEQCFNDDRLFSRRLPDFDPNTNWTPGLIAGCRLAGTMVYDVATEGGRTCIGQSLRYELEYCQAADSDRRLVPFSSYYAAIVRVGSNDETTDRILLEMEGDL